MLCNHAYVVVGRHKIFATDIEKGSWKDSGLENLFINLCIEEAKTRGKRENSLNVKSCDIIGSRIKEQKGVILSER